MTRKTCSPTRCWLRWLQPALAYLLLAGLCPGQSDESARTDLITLGDEWRYLHTGSRPDNWSAADFDDSGWGSGNAPLGYGEADVVTQLTRRSDPLFVTTYYRKTLSFGQENPPERWFSFIGKIRRDDGAVLYLNGTEIFRTNMPDGEIEHTTRSATATAGSNEEMLFDFTVPRELLIEGDNVLAVEVHQSSPGSSDLIFDLSLSARRYLFEEVLTHFEDRGFVYYLVGNRNLTSRRLLRYELATGQWLPAFYPGEEFGEVEGIGSDGEWLYFASSDKGIRRMHLSGGDDEQIVDGPLARTTRIFIYDGKLIRVGSRTTSYDLSDGSMLGETGFSTNDSAIPPTPARR